MSSPFEFSLLTHADSAYLGREIAEKLLKMLKIVFTKKVIAIAR